MNFTNIDFSSPAVIIGLVIAVALIAVAIAVAVEMRKKRTARLRAQFGQEYDLTLAEAGSRKRAEEALNARVKRMHGLKIRDLTVAERDRYLSEWSTVQSRFIDHPRGAVTEADELVNSLLVARGYPAGGFDQRASDISVHHSALVGPYRVANSITARAGRNEATTEELRNAMIQYRTLFDALLGTTVAATLDQTAPVLPQRIVA
jgi:lipopolysaccharide export LptBFGC system permease protein LptF